MRVILGVSASVAAYKSVLILRLLRKAGIEVQVIATANTRNFVGFETFAALSGNPVGCEIFSANANGNAQVDHVEIARNADLFLLAPASADTLARLATGRADDMLTATALVATCPLVACPAMHTQMWMNSATAANVATLRARGWTIMDPSHGELTSQDYGKGRLPEPEEIVDFVLNIYREKTKQCFNESLNQHIDCQVEASECNSFSQLSLTNKIITITAGGTREPIDPVRFIGNRSSGRMGLELAKSALNLGGKVNFIAANIDKSLLAELENHPNAYLISIFPVQTANQLAAAVKTQAKDSDYVFMAAAVADYRPAKLADHKLKKTSTLNYTLDLVENEDILASLVNERKAGNLPNNLVIIGFAAETGDIYCDFLSHGQAKAKRKGADYLVCNRVGEQSGFGDVKTTLYLLNRNGKLLSTLTGNKRDVSPMLWAELLKSAVND